MRGAFGKVLMKVSLLRMLHCRLVLLFNTCFFYLSYHIKERVCMSVAVSITPLVEREVESRIDDNSNVNIKVLEVNRLEGTLG